MNTEEQQQAVYRAMAEFIFNKPSPPTWVSACLVAKEIIGATLSLAILDEDQEPPTIKPDGMIMVDYRKAQQAMLKAGWKKVLPK